MSPHKFLFIARQTPSNTKKKLYVYMCEHMGVHAAHCDCMYLWVCVYMPGIYVPCTEHVCSCVHGECVHVYLGWAVCLTCLAAALLEDSLENTKAGPQYMKQEVWVGYTVTTQLISAFRLCYFLAMGGEGVQ